MYPLNPDIMWQDMRSRRDRLLGRGTRAVPVGPHAEEVLPPSRRPAREVAAAKLNTTVDVPAQRRAGEVGQAPRSGRRPTGGS